MMETARKPQGGPPHPDGSWQELVVLIQRNDPSAVAELYAIVSRCARYYLLRALGPQEAEDQLHESFLAVLEPIQRGDLRDPKALLPFVSGVVRRRVALQIHRKMRRRRRELDWTAGLAAPEEGPSPEEIARRAEQRWHAARILDRLPERDRQILQRFYVFEHSREHICRDLGLTDTQFRLFKSRAIARLGELWRRTTATGRESSRYFGRRGTQQLGRTTNTTSPRWLNAVDRIEATP
jgi:RNA polymerase sigma-70 factor (ECF subfamily)